MCQGSFGRWSNQSPVGNARLHTGLKILDAKIQQQKIVPEFHPALCAVVFNRSFTGGRRTRGPVASPWRSRSYQDWKATASPVNLDGNFSNRTFTTNSLCFPQVHLTYLTLPWWHIVKDILETRESSMLTFWSLGTGWFLKLWFSHLYTFATFKYLYFEDYAPLFSLFSSRQTGRRTSEDPT